METQTLINHTDVLSFLEKNSTNVTIDIDFWKNHISDTSYGNVVFDCDKFSFEINIHYKATVHKPYNYDITEIDVDINTIHDNEGNELEFSKSEMRLLEKELSTSLNITLFKK